MSGNLGHSPTNEARKSELLDGIIAYELDELSDEQVIDLFQELHDTGLAYQLTGHYGRKAEIMIENQTIQGRHVLGLRRAIHTFTNGAI